MTDRIDQMRAEARPTYGNGPVGMILSARHGAELLNIVEVLRDTVVECEGYFDQRADAEYLLDKAAPVGNEEMHLLLTIRAALAKLEVKP